MAGTPKYEKGTNTYKRWGITPRRKSTLDDARKREKARKALEAKKRRRQRAIEKAANRKVAIGEQSVLNDLLKGV